MRPNASPPPDWVVLGTPTTDGKVAIYASKDLTEAELRYEAEHDYDFLAMRTVLLSRRIELTVGMRTYTVVVADTYEQALRHLFDTWSPEPDRPTIEPAQRAISA